MLFMIKVGDIVVIDSIFVDAVVTPRLYRVVRVLSKSVELNPISDNGESINLGALKIVRNTSVVAILNNVDEYKVFAKMNAELKEAYLEYRNRLNSFEKNVKDIKSKTQKALKAS